MKSFVDICKALELGRGQGMGGITFLKSSVPLVSVDELLALSKDERSQLRTMFNEGIDSTDVMSYLDENDLGNMLLMCWGDGRLRNYLT
jgi:hypothetical protein